MCFCGCVSLTICSSMSICLSICLPLYVRLYIHLSVHPSICLSVGPSVWLMWLTEGVFLVRDDCVLNGPLGRSLRLFARTAHSAHSLRSAPLRYARFARSLCSRARSLTLLTPSWDSWKSRIYIHASNAFQRNKRVFGRHQKHALRSYVAIFYCCTQCIFVRDGSIVVSSWISWVALAEIGEAI